MEQTKIYVLVDPRNLKIRYIGITVQSLKDRLDGHIYGAKFRPNENWHKSRWINQLLSLNMKPIIRQIAIKNTREEAESLETKLISKYRDSHKLTNIVDDAGKFASTGARSASILNSKKVYVYNYDGTFYKEFASEKECSTVLGIYLSAIEKCLKGTLKFCHNFQFRFEKHDKIESLVDYGIGNSKEVLLQDTETGEIIRYKSALECKQKLKLSLKTTGLKSILGELNKKFGNKYLMWYENKWQQSTYYNTAVFIETSDYVYKFQSVKNLLPILGLKTKALAQEKVKEKILEHFNNVISIKFNQPLCLVLGEDN